jgi:hypothetical protein
MNWRTAGWAAAVAVFLLTLSALLTFAAKDDLDAFPTLDGRTPSGLLGFAEAVRAEGYRFEMDRSTHPKLGPDDIPMVIELTKPKPKKDELFADRADRWKTDDDPKSLRKSVIDFVKGGGTLLYVQMKQSYQDASSSHQPTEFVNVAGGKAAKVSTSTVDAGTFLEGDKKASPIWQAKDRQSQAEPLLTVRSLGKGTVFTVADGLPLTNRFIGEADNAEVGLAMVRAAVPKGKRIVALEAAFGNVHDKGLFEWAGRWAEVARDQFFLVVVVVCLTLAIRFGTPVTERVAELGTRSMVDAMAANLARLKQPTFALNILLADVYDRVRIALRAPVGTTRADLLRQMPEELGRQVHLCEAATQEDRPGPFQRRARLNTLLAQAENLDRLTTWFEMDSRNRRLG